MTDKPVTQIQKPHHQVEDIPPDDVDTKVTLFEQSLNVVKGSAESAEWLRKNAEIVLGEVFHTAEKAKKRRTRRARERPVEWHTGSH